MTLVKDGFFFIVAAVAAHFAFPFWTCGHFQSVLQWKRLSIIPHTRTGSCFFSPYASTFSSCKKNLLLFKLYSFSFEWTESENERASERQHKIGRIIPTQFVQAHANICKEYKVSEWQIRNNDIGFLAKDILETFYRIEVWFIVYIFLSSLHSVNLHCSILFVVVRLTLFLFSDVFVVTFV